MSDRNKKAHDAALAIIIKPEAYLGLDNDCDVAFATAVIDDVRAIVGTAYRFLQKPGDHLYHTVHGSYEVRDAVLAAFIAAGFDVSLAWMEGVDPKLSDVIEIRLPEVKK